MVMVTVPSASAARGATCSLTRLMASGTRALGCAILALGGVDRDAVWLLGGLAVATALTGLCTGTTVGAGVRGFPNLARSSAYQRLIRSSSSFHALGRRGANRALLFGWTLAAGLGLRSGGGGFSGSATILAAFVSAAAEGDGCVTASPTAFAAAGAGLAILAAAALI